MRDESFRGVLFPRNRYYEPQTGRFTQPDPIGLAGGINLYGFANGDPVNFSDPFGLMACDPPDKPCRDFDAGDASAVFQQLSGMGPAMERDIVSFLPKNAVSAVAGLGAGAVLGRVAGALGRAVSSMVGKRSGEVVTAGTPLFRVWGGESQAFGASWTTADPGTVAGFRAAAGLPTANAGRFVSEGTLMTTRGVTVRASLPGAGGPGGLPEVVIPNAIKQVRLTRVSGANPPF